MHRGLGMAGGGGGGGGVGSMLSLQRANSGASSGGGILYDGKIAGLYDLEETLGRGHFAVVKLARHVFTGEKVAVKVIDKTKLDEVSRAHLFQEVRCMKLVQHPNVVRLYEVIDTQTKLYLILELGDGGDLYDYIMRHDSGLSENVAREYFRQIVRAISYCHRLHVCHRDLKPENVVFFEKLGVVKLTDFGFSNKFCPGQKLETSCGSLAYSAPEILLGDSYDAPAVDVWSLGVILYMLVCGQAPFQEANDSETLTMIMDCKYTIPHHVSDKCKSLIARMLIREPEKRATLAQIASDPWLAEGAESTAEYLPLVSRHQVSEEDHTLIIQKMVNGSIATKEEILEALDKNEYNHITATYFLLAERKLRAHRQEQAVRSGGAMIGKRPEQLSLQSAVPGKPSIVQAGVRILTDANAIDSNVNSLQTPGLLSVPRTPGDLPQRARKCSIVQEEEDEEDLSSCSGREELTAPHCSLNRRGSRSEGRLNVALQERIAAESERRRQEKQANSALAGKENIAAKVSPHLTAVRKTGVVNRPKSVVDPKLVGCAATNPGKWKIGLKTNISVVNRTPTVVEPTGQEKPQTTTTTILNESLTISIPIHTSPNISSKAMSKYKTMPSPTRPNVLASTPLQLNEIFEEGGDVGASESTPRLQARHFVRNHHHQTNASYEQRRSKFHKARTASCSSSDASDDDSESRKKRAHKLTEPNGKPYRQGRRDSHDDSSDSQDQGSAGQGAGGARTVSNGTTEVSSRNAATQPESKNGGGGNQTSGGRKNHGGTFSRRHRTGRRRTNETRLRESQSLNRITEVQEDVHAHGVVVANASISTAQTLTATTDTVSPKVKSFGARFFQGWATMGSAKKSPCEEKHHVSRKDAETVVKSKTLSASIDVNKLRSSDEKENFKLKILSDKTSSKKMRLLGRYFQVHKKLCIPLPGIFGGGGGGGRRRLYKAQSCSSLARDRVSSPTVPSSSVVGCEIKNRPVSEVRNGLLLLGSDSDINQNNGAPVKNNSSPYEKTNGGAGLGIVDKIALKSVCSGIGGICQLHLGDASKCCSLC